MGPFFGLIYPNSKDPRIDLDQMSIRNIPNELKL